MKGARMSKRDELGEAVSLGARGSLEPMGLLRSLGSLGSLGESLVKIRYILTTEPDYE